MNTYREPSDTEILLRGEVLDIQDKLDKLSVPRPCGCTFGHDCSRGRRLWNASTIAYDDAVAANTTGAWESWAKARLNFWSHFAA